MTRREAFYFIYRVVIRLVVPFYHDLSNDFNAIASDFRTCIFLNYDYSLARLVGYDDSMASDSGVKH